jgi:replicative DNA helicase
VSWLQPLSTTTATLAATNTVAGAWPHSEPKDAHAVTTGFAALDRGSPLVPGRATLIGGDPGVGVTALLLAMTGHVTATLRRPVVYLTSHHGPAELAARLTAALDRVALHELQPGPVTVQPRQPPDPNAARVDDLPLLVIDARNGCTALQLTRTIDRLLQALGAPALVILDRPDALVPAASSVHRSSASQLATAVRIVVEHADEVGYPLLVSQRPRPGVGPFPRPGERLPPARSLPLFDPLADAVEALWWLHRPELYAYDDPQVGTGQLHLLWQRAGPTGYVELTYLHHRATWTARTDSTDPNRGKT